MESPPSVETYLEGFTGIIRDKLEEIRRIIREEAPEAEELISYGMPAFRYHGILVYFAAHKSHIGFYPTGSGIAAFHDRFDGLKWSKGAVQFPVEAALPEELVRDMVRFRLKENLNKAALRPKRAGKGG